MTDEIFDFPVTRSRADDDIRDHAYYRKLAKAEYERDETGEAISYFQMAYEKAVGVLGYEPGNAEELSKKAKSSWSKFEDDDAYDYYKAAYEIVVRNI